MPGPLFIATQRFDPSDGERWRKYCEWAGIPALTEVISLDHMLCPRLIDGPEGEDWSHVVCEDYRLDYFHHLDYLLQRIGDVRPRNILGLHRNPVAAVIPAPGPGDFEFCGFDLIDEQTQISALTNCGGFPMAFHNEELNRFGLIDRFERAGEVRRLLAARYPDESHARCEMYQLWRLRELPPDGNARKD